MISCVVIVSRHSVQTLRDPRRAALPPSSIFRTLFQVPYPASPLFATLTKTPGVGGYSSHSGTLSHPNVPMRMAFTTIEDLDSVETRSGHRGWGCGTFGPQFFVASLTYYLITSSSLNPLAATLTKNQGEGPHHYAWTCSTCLEIQAYVFSRPSRSGRLGAQRSLARINLLSEFRPRTPSGPGICRMPSFFPAISMTISASRLMVTISSEPILTGPVKSDSISRRTASTHSSTYKK